MRHSLMRYSTDGHRGALASCVSSDFQHSLALALRVKSGVAPVDLCSVNLVMHIPRAFA